MRADPSAATKYAVIPVARTCGSRSKSLRPRRHLVRDQYFHPQHDDFRPRTMWSLSNAFTSVLKEIDPVPQYKATGKLAGFRATGAS